jgi:hypothetical protein
MTEKLKKLQDKVETLMRENKVYSYELDFDLDNDRLVYIELEWGDWKHDHLRLEWLMEKNDFRQIGEVTTEEDGSDCYSAIHTFIYLGDEY